MATSFHRITRSMQRDTGLPAALGITLATVLLGLWCAWAFRAEIKEFEVSDSARLEVDAAAHPVQAPAGGRIVKSNLALGRTVQAGEVLAELDTSSERLALAEERARYSTIQPQIASLEAQINAERAGADADRSVSNYSDDAAVAQYRQADIDAALAEKQAERARKMHAEGILSAADMERAEADARGKRAAAETRKAAIARVQPELLVKQRDREAKMREIAASEAKLESDLRVSAATIERLTNEIERRQIRASVSGRLAECAALPAGSQVTEGQQLGVVVPSSELRVVAQFQPSVALGKIRAGEAATLRLDGFPWAQFGVVTARVTAVASEIRDNKVRVELAVLHAPAIPLQHGLPGVVQVETAHTTPARMLLRSAGTLAGAR